MFSFNDSFLNDSSNYSFFVYSSNVFSIDSFNDISLNDSSNDSSSVYSFNDLPCVTGGLDLSSP